MDFDELVKTRRSIKKFKNEQVSNEDIITIIESARLSPSLKNRQPWKFIAIKGDKKEFISDLMMDWFNENKNNTTTVNKSALSIKQASVLILVFRDSDNTFERRDTLSLGACIGNILLKSTELGVGSKWIADTWYVKDNISNYLGVDLELYSAIALGIPDENFSPKPKKSIEDILTFIE
ncbi:MAG: nitroreductase family protein [Clostridia bacterium]|nr:nitroreductase family protein [Clostridia bacterium]